MTPGFNRNWLIALVDNYLFNVSDTGQFAVFMWRNEAWTTLIDWADSTAIVPEAVNRLAVIGKA